MSAHTPGPWRQCREGECTCGMTWSIPGDFPVCTVAKPEPGRKGNVNLRHLVAVVHEHMADEPEVIYQSVTPEMAAANARLIAAAPDLLAALRPFAAGLHGVGSLENFAAAVEAARAAIAKAIGG